MSADLLAASPEKIPAKYQGDLDKLSARTRSLMNGKSLPYSCMANFAQRRYTTLEDAADRFDTPEKARDATKGIMGIQVPQDLQEEDLKYMEVKMYQVVKEAKQQQKEHPEIGTITSNGGDYPIGSFRGPTYLGADKEASVMTKHDRTDLQKSYLTAWGVPCPGIGKQCKMETIERQYLKCSKGDVGSMQSKFVLPHVPESPDEKPTEVPKSSAPGETRTENVRRIPTTRRQVDRFFDFWQTLLLMCIAPFRNLPAFMDFHKEDLDAFYSWLHSKNVAGYNHDGVEPSPGQLLWFERQCWSEMEILMCDESVTLKQALKKVQNDSCLLIRELYDKVRSNHQGGGNGDGSRRGRDRQRGQKGADRSRSGRKGDRKGGQGGQGGQGRGGQGRGGQGGQGGQRGRGSGGKNQRKGDKNGKGGKGLLSQWKDNWAKEDPKGTPYCLDFHVKGNCPRGQACPYSHKCPVMSSNGYVCDKLGHTKDACKQLGR